MKKLPIGIEDFQELITKDYYYTDKTGLIKEILEKGLKVLLYTRPRRFGKTLNMSMFKSFFEIGTDPKLFEDLAISKEKELCEKYLGKYPVIFISLKSIDCNSYEEALDAFSTLISKEARRIKDLIDITKFNSWYQDLFNKLLGDKKNIETIRSSLATMSELLERYYKTKVIILIDEYDVPLDKAQQHGYYNEMITLIRAFLGSALKTNSSLEFAVLTGCMRISKESIFTGLNNFEMNGISDTLYSSYFGLTEQEVDLILDYYDLSESHTEAKEWYDGYLFGDSYVYCPWSIIKYVKSKTIDKSADPEDYWVNSSGNEIITSFLKQYGDFVSEDFEQLLAGKSLKKQILETLTYGDVMASPDNIWSLLYMTGYLTKDNTNYNVPVDRRNFFVKIPNKEVTDVFITSSNRWMNESISYNDKEQFFTALWSGDTKALTRIISDLLFNTISYFDYAEKFYHAFLAGLLVNKRYKVDSNYETGLGRSDIVIKDSRNRKAAILELKFTKDEKKIMESCNKALDQIKEKRYVDAVRNEGYREILEYGATFYKKECIVIARNISLQSSISSETVS